MAQIRSAVLEIFHTQTKTHRQRQKTLRSSLACGKHARMRKKTKMNDSLGKQSAHANCSGFVDDVGQPLQQNMSVTWQTLQWLNFKE